jgi:hypothetical protein
MRKLTALILLVLAGCATILDGTTQTVAIQSIPSGAACHLQSPNGQWDVTTPAVVTVQKSGGAINVTCRGPDGSAGSGTITSSMSGAVVANALLGGIVGGGVDVIDGAAYRYQPAITVNLVPARQS